MKPTILRTFAAILLLSISVFGGTQLDINVNLSGGGVASPSGLGAFLDVYGTSAHDGSYLWVPTDPADPTDGRYEEIDGSKWLEFDGTPIKGDWTGSGSASGRYNAYSPVT